LESDGCGGVVKCGSCEKGFVCVQGQCLLDQSEKPLEISSVKAIAYGSTAVVYWETSIEADSLVEFGETQKLGLEERGPESVTEHSVFLTGLKPETLYYYRVSSKNGARKQSSIQSFTTKKETGGKLAVLFIGVNPASKAQYEGQSFAFTAITNRQEAGLSFDWDFGDGQSIEGIGSLAPHAFYGVGFEKEKSFTVSVKVKSEDGNTASASVKVRVLKAFFKPIVFKPKLFERHPKDGNLFVSMAFFDRADKVIDCNRVSVKAVFARKPIELKCVDGNSFSGSLRLWSAGLNETEILEVEASLESKGEKHYSKTRIPVYFEPERVEVKGSLGEKKYYFNDTIGEERVRFLVHELYVVKPVELTASLVSGNGKERVAVKQAEGGYDYIISLNHRVSETDLLHGLRLKLEGKDSMGNVIDSVQGIPVEKDNPDLMVAVIEPLAKKRVFAFGQVMVVRAKLLSKSYALRNPSVELECQQLGLNKEMRFDSVRKEYHSEVLLPFSGHSQLSFKLSANAKLRGKELADFEYFEVKLSNALKPAFVSPKASEKLLFADKVEEIGVRVLQPNNYPFKTESLEAVLRVDGAEQPITLNFDEETHTYKAVLPKPLTLGKHSLELELRGAFTGKAYLDTDIEKETFYYNALLLFGAVLAVIFLLVFLTFLFWNLAAERKRLLEEKARLSGLKKKFKYEFYKRHVTEKEFNNGVKQLELGLKGIDSLLRKGSWIWTGLLRTIYRTSEPKRMPERFQARMLVNRLAGRRGEFSRVEIASALRQEGYSDAVIERVIERLFHEKAKAA